MEIVKPKPQDICERTFAFTEEARGSTTKKEFSRKMGIALSEAREALYWLRLIADGGLVAKSRLTLLVKEADELVRIVIAIVKKSRGTAR